MPGNVKTTTKISFLCAFIISLLSISACAPPPETSVVTDVIDGDTIVIASGEKVRYIGIDTPEIYPEAEEHGIAAMMANRHLVEGKRVRLERDVSDTDKYGRLLRYVYVDELFINAELVRLGLAEATSYPPDTKNQRYFEELEMIARETGRGMWAE